MASTPFSLDAPPPQPPSLVAQGSPNPIQAIGQRLAEGLQQQRDSGQDFLLTRATAIQKVLDEMARASEPFAPFAARIKDLLNAGLSKAVSAPGADASQPRPLPGSAAPAEGATFPS